MGNDVPLEIILDIFLRLPADTIIRFRGVCKLWNKLTRDPYFIDLHLSKWLHKQPSGLIIAPQTRFSNTNSSLFLVDGIEDGGWRAREIQVEYLLGNDLELVGSCNGLICMIPAKKLVGKWDPMFICNPITGESMRLPKSNPADEFFGLDRWVGIVGFGYDHETRKYKVVRVSIALLTNQFWGEIITLGESSWRKLDIEYNTLILFINKPMLFLNGFIHWINCCDGVIVVFEVGSEKFHIVRFPYLKPPAYGSRLINFQGSLAIASADPILDPFDDVKLILQRRLLVAKLAGGLFFERFSYNASGFREYGTLYALLSDGTMLFFKCCQTNLPSASDHPTEKKKYLCVASYNPVEEKSLRFEVSGFVTMSEPVLFMPSLVPLPQ